MKDDCSFCKDLLEVVSAGILTTVQDLGRFGFQRHGVPVSGAMDSYAMRVANLLVGNDANCACLEMTLTGPILRVVGPCEVAVTGADLKTMLNGERIDTWTARPMKMGDELTFSAAEHGCRSYLAVSGGIEVPLVLGSRSTYLRGGFGGYQGRPIKKGDFLRGTPLEGRKRIRYFARESIPRYRSEERIRVVLGPQDDLFTENGIKTFFDSLYEVTPDSDRMGYRLSGPAIEHSGKPEIVSDGVARGAIQVPGDRMPIVLMKDAQTTGGYPKIAHVISPDLDVLAQLRPGDKVRFERIDVREAHGLVRQFFRKLQDLKESIRERSLAPEFPDNETLMRLQGSIR